MKIEMIVPLLRRYCWELGLVALVLCAQACSEAALDPNTANATHRPTDTLISHDTTTDRDTTVLVDTIISVDRDTVIHRDTSIQIRTQIRTVIITIRDSIVTRDTVRLIDTVVHNDTLHLWDTLRTHDTIKLRDTLHVGDTVRVIDTVFKHDTTKVTDTIRQVSAELERIGMIYRKLDGGRKDSMPVEIDDASMLNVTLRSGVGPIALQLRMIGRVTQTYDTTQWGVPPSWFYLLIPKTTLSGGKASRELVADPRAFTSQPGLAIVPRPPYNAAWLATHTPAGDNVFTVTGVDTNTRWIYAFVRVRFDPYGARIDSLSLRLRY